MNAKVIALPDGEGVIGNQQFWANFFEIINFKYIGTESDLDTLTRESNKYFPTSVCTNSKVRLGNAVLLSEKVTHFLFFLRNDKYVNNCPASVYRIRWIKEKFPNITTIIWPYDLDKNASFEENLLKLARKLTSLTIQQEEKIKKLKIPQRQAVYTFPSNNNNPKVLLIGVAPHSIDPYRKTWIMDYLMEKFNVYSPLSFQFCNFELPERTITDTVYFKEKPIYFAIDEALKQNFKGFLLVSDPLDLPGNYTFPLIKSYLETKNIYSFSPKVFKKCYLEIKATYKNMELIKNKLDEFYEVLK